MSRHKYKYNPHTLQFEKYRVPVKAWLLRFFSILSAVLVTGGGLYLAADALLPSQKQLALERELQQMKYEYNVINNQINNFSEHLSKLQQRDREVHRLVLGMDPIDPAIWQAGVGGHERYASLMQWPNAGNMMTQTHRRIDQLSRQLELQAMSLDDLASKAAEREEMLASIPSIKPVRVDLLRREVTLLSGFGMRIHPVFKVAKMHTGIDFTAPEGTMIQATGDGLVTSVRQSKTGYGLHVVIDHGFKYQTLYGHMSQVIVKEGERVKKGQQIGTVGRTGTATAPHLHYEVIFDGHAVDPIHYCLDGLTPEEYAALVDLASIANQSFD